MRLKISVLASGAILLDGQPADLERLDGALELSLIHISEPTRPY